MVPPVTVPSLQTQITWMSAVQMPVQCLHSPNGPELLRNPLPLIHMNSFHTPSSSLAYQDVGHLQNVRYVNGSDTASIKRLILQYGSVSAPLCVNLKKYYSKSTGAYYCNNNTGTNHQLTIVGWDDDYSTANFTSGIRPSKKGAWIAKNSYGEDFGNDGYIYISYQDNSLNHQKRSTADSDSLVFAYDMENSDNYSHNYQYDGSASCTYMPIPSGSSLSNVF